MLESIHCETLTIFPSWRCNIQCAHCGFDCGPKRRQMLAFESAMHYIEAANSEAKLKMVAYSGGETFLHYSYLLGLMERAHSLGIKAGVATNAYWATSTRGVENKLARLLDCGLVEIMISFDDYHLNHVPLDNVRRLVAAGIASGVRIGLNLLATQKSTIRKSNALEILGLPVDLAEDSNRLWIRESSPLPVGRAKDFFSSAELIAFDEQHFVSRPCPFAIRNLAITPESELYACCGFGGASEDGPASDTNVGNLRYGSFADLYRRAQFDLFLNIVARFGPQLLLAMARKRQKHIPIRKRFISNCDICLELSTNQALRKVVVESLASNITPPDDLAPKQARFSENELDLGLDEPTGKSWG